MIANVQPFAVQSDYAIYSSCCEALFCLSFTLPSRSFTIVPLPIHLVSVHHLVHTSGVPTGLDLRKPPQDPNTISSSQQRFMMRLILCSNLVALWSIAPLCDALPFVSNPQGNAQIARRATTYSVVPVDGGTSSAPVATQTIVETATTLPPVTTTVMSTILSTIVVTDAETPITIVVTISETPAASTTSSTSSQMTTTPPELITTTTTTTTSMPPATELTTTTTTATPAAITSVTPWAQPSTATITAGPPWVPYDNGLWHTTYYYSEASSLSSPSIPQITLSFSNGSSISVSPTATPTLDTFIGTPSDGTFALHKRVKVARQNPTTLGVLIWASRTGTYTVTPYLAATPT